MNSLRHYIVSVVFLLLNPVKISTAKNFREVEQTILENLLKSPYDKRIRPINQNASDSSGVVVTVDMFIRSFDVIDDVKMQYSIQLTFRLRWNDYRLKYDHTNPPETLEYLTLSRTSPVWTPDLFFPNEKVGHFHNTLLPNNFIRVFPNGDVLYSSRLSLTLLCHMHLHNFPFDIQSCYISVKSYGYTQDHLKLKWEDTDPIQLTQHLDLPQFYPRNFTTGYCDEHVIQDTSEESSCLAMKFELKRDSAYYTSQIFVPCILIVLLGWLSFWVSRFQPATRVFLLFGNFFMMAILFVAFNSSQVPLVSYTKASDVWTISCFMFVFASMFLFFIVHYITFNKSQAEVRRNEGRKILFEWKNFTKKSFWSWLANDEPGLFIDVISRFMYPLAFLIVNLVYWNYYN